GVLQPHAPREPLHLLRGVGTGDALEAPRVELLERRAILGAAAMAAPVAAPPAGAPPGAAPDVARSVTLLRLSLHRLGHVLLLTAWGDLVHRCAPVARVLGLRRFWELRKEEGPAPLARHLTRG